MATDRELEAMTTEDVITYIKTGRADAYDRWANGGEHRNMHVADYGDDEQRDYAEEYNRKLCPACGTSPCESEDDHESERIAEMYEAAGDK